MDKVLCLLEFEKIELSEEEIWKDEIDYNVNNKYLIKEKLTPLINYPHSDKENGQKEVHYHVDDRYISNTSYKRITLPLKKDTYLVYRKLNKIKNVISGITPSKYIKNSKLKYNCIYKNKCPHRGYDLSNEKPDKNGIITCPLHGLKFNSKTMKLINEV